MGVVGLKAALARGEPLVEVIVKFRVEVDAAATTNRINAECEVFDLYPQPWYDDPQLRVGSATREALERLFGLRLVRVRLERYDEVTDTWGHWPDAFRWKEVKGPELSRFDIGELIENVGISQLGQDDDGQAWE